MLEQGVAVARREADPERVGRRLVEAALVQELTGRQRVGGGELPGVELLRHPVRLDQPTAGGPLGAVAADVAVLAAQLDAVLVGEPLDRLDEAEPVDLHQERDDVAALLAAEAVEELTGRGDVERRRLLVVEGAQALLGAAAGVAQRDVGGDHLVDAAPSRAPRRCPPRGSGRPRGGVYGGDGRRDPGLHNRPGRSVPPAASAVPLVQTTCCNAGHSLCSGGRMPIITRPLHTALAIAVAALTAAALPGTNASGEPPGASAAAPASPELSETTPPGRPALAGGRRPRLLDEHRRRPLPGGGWHIRGEMGGVWTPPIKLVDGVWLRLADQWLGDA